MRKEDVKLETGLGVESGSSWRGMRVVDMIKVLCMHSRNSQRIKSEALVSILVTLCGVCTPQWTRRVIIIFH